MPHPFRPSPFVRALATLIAAAGVAGELHAQVIDDLAVRREGANAVIEVRFASEVQFQRMFATRAGDLVFVFYSLVSTVHAEQRPSPQGLRLGAKQGLPDVRIADEADRGERNRRLVLRFTQSTQVIARAGRGNRSIELVLVGQGAAVRSEKAATPALAPSPAPETPALAPSQRRFVISLQRSEDSNLQLTQRIPGTLQSYEVFTSQRTIDGRPRYEFNLGYFATLADAQAVLPQLSAFPQAEIVALQRLEPAPAAAAARAAAPQAAVSKPDVTAAPSPAAAPTTPVAPAPPEPPAAPETGTARTAPAAVPGPAVPIAPSPPSPPPVAVAPVPSVPPTPAAPATPPSPAALEERGRALLATARAAYDKQDYTGALVPLNELLNLPPTGATREAQELAGMSRLRLGEFDRARMEFETYLQLYPQGQASERVRRELATLPATPAPSTSPVTAAAQPAAREKGQPQTTVNGSVSSHYFGGNGRVRSQDFQDSPISGLPQIVGDPLLNSDRTRQWFSDVDLNWRRRDDEQDMRFVFRDSYLKDLERPEKSRNRLSSLYVDYRSIAHGFGARLGRQSPTGGGVFGRFDGVQAYAFARPKLKLGVVAGVPEDKLFDTKRHFYGASIDADSWLPNLGTGLYTIQQRIDGEIDRQSVGLEMRYFKNGASVFSQFDYDTKIGGLNIATVQGNLVLEDSTVFNVLYDRRALTLLALGNALTFADPANPGPFLTLKDRLATTTVAALRNQIKDITPYITQAQAGLTKPISAHWQIGGSGQLTRIGAIPPVPEVLGFETGRPATGNLYTVSGQLIGLNLYSSRDTHVLASSLITSPSLNGYLVSYNNSSIAWNVWQIEPSLQYFHDRTSQGGTDNRWTPGLRLTYRGWQRWALESTLTYEIGRSTRSTPDPTDPTLTTITRESSTRVNYSLGARYEF